MVHRIDDDTLARFFDGELPVEEERAVAAALAEDPELAARLERLESCARAIRGVFDAQLEPPPAPMVEAVQQGFARRRVRQHRGGGAGWSTDWQRWLMPVAASIAIAVLGLATFDRMIERRVGAALDQMRAERASDLAMLASAMQDVLETRESGTEVSFTNEKTGFGVTIVPVRTWRSATGHWCREFLEIGPGADRKAAPVSTACRTPEGLWVRTETELKDGTPPLDLFRAKGTEL